MAEPAAIAYRAFLSYSHRDTAWGKWLHAALEGYRIDKDLVGRATAAGTLPSTLRPIFRDREDFAAGHSLTAQTLAALEASQFLIVLCSPNAAQSQYVNEEIRRFKAMGGAERVIPLIVDGEPGDPARECFPPALRFKVGADGVLTDEREEPIAADARPRGDGKETAKLKVVAALLGLGLDEIVRRAERARRRSVRIRNGIIAALALLMVAASGSAVLFWHQLKTNEAFLDATLDRFTSLTNRAVKSAQTYSLPLAVTLGFLEEAEGMLDVMAKYGRPTPKLKQRQIVMLIAFADNYRDLGKTSEWEKRLIQAQGLAVELAQNDTGDPLWRWERARVHADMGDLHMVKGNLATALADYRAALAISERLVKDEPGNGKWQRALSVTSEKIGDVHFVQGRLAEALISFRASLAIREQLSEAEPGNLQWQRDRSVLYQKIGDVQLAQGNLADALASVRSSLAIRERLSQAEPGNSGWQYDLSLAHEKVGDVQVAQGDLTGALASFRAGRAITERLTKADPGNTRWQYDLGGDNERIGEMLMAQGDLAGAMKSYQARHDIISALAKSDPGNAQWQRDLGVSLGKIGNVQAAQGNLAEALASFRSSLMISEQLAKADPDNARWQRDLSFSYERVGNALGTQGNVAAALASFRSSVAIRERLAKTDPGNAQWQFDLVTTLWTLATNNDEAPQRWAAIVAILRKLKDENRLLPDWAKWLPLAEENLAKLTQAQAAPR